MSATLETNPGASWRKRCREDDKIIPLDIKRPRFYFRLESESSKASEEDTESIYSVQGRETDVVKDTTDTESRTGTDQDEYEVEIEYEVASLSEDETAFCNSSSSSEGMMLAAAAAAAICDSSLEAWITDCEDSDNSSLDESSFGRSDFSTCVQCKSENDNPLYRYCEKCFQDRKKFYPPRPRRNKKANKKKKEMELPVKLDTLRNCLSGLSQDSGIGSSQECPPLDLDQIVVPKHLTPGTSRITSYGEEKVKAEDKEASVDKVIKDVKNDGKNSSLLSSIITNDIFSDTSSVSEKSSKKPSSNDSSNVERLTVESSSRGSKRRIRQSSESSLSDFDVKRPKRLDKKVISSLKPATVTSDLGSESTVSSFSSTTTEKSENSELCIFCNDAPKDSIFLHTNIAHRCCCYKCAKKTLNTIKRCPICNRSVNKVVRIFTS